MSDELPSTDLLARSAMVGFPAGFTSLSINLLPLAYTVAIAVGVLASNRFVHRIIVLLIKADAPSANPTGAGSYIKRHSNQVVLGVLPLASTTRKYDPSLASRARRSTLRRLCLSPPLHTHTYRTHTAYAHTARLRSVLLRLLLILFEGCVHDGPSNEDDHEDDHKDDREDDEKKSGALSSPRLMGSTSCPPPSEYR